uniref:Origin of replication complex subunit 4 n=1 Tax=Oryza glumipatula TaxID=40148 RepID=A0A0D9YD90_9ORYZ
MAAAAAAAAASVASQAQAVLRGRLCDQAVVHSALRSSPDTNYSKLKYLVASSVSEACNNSVLLLGPRGCGKAAVRFSFLVYSSAPLSAVFSDAGVVFDEMCQWAIYDFTLWIRLNGMLHSDDNCATKASSDDNTEFMIDMLRECGLAHKTIIFVLEEFDLFAQGKQRLLYSLLDAMQSLTSQAVVIGVSCRLDADQLLEKRVRSRFSHRKLLFVPSSVDSLQRLMEHLLALPEDSPLPTKYVREYNARITSIFNDKKFKGILSSLTDADATTSHILRFLVVSYMDIDSGLLSMQSFMNALSSMQRQPKMDSLQEYKSVQDAYKTSDKYSHTVCFRAFEHLLDRELISFADNRGRNQALEYRPVKLLISSRELAESLKLNTTCPAVLQKLLDRERYM